jgi:pilus assembly protein FimV
VLLLTARARRKKKQGDQELDQDDDEDFSEVKEFDDVVVPAKTAAVVQEKAAGLNKSESSDFDLDDVLSDSPKREEPKSEVTQRVEPVVAVDPDPVDDIPELKAESEEASQQAESLSGEVKLDFPEDEPVAEKDNPIFDDLEMLEKGALSAQEELDEIRKQPLPAAEPDADDAVDSSTEEAQQPETDTPAEPEQPTVDLDVDVPNPKVDDATQQEVATKLDLAGAYVEIGDSDGARELLNEIVSKGDADQVRKAKALLASLN